MRRFGLEVVSLDVALEGNVVMSLCAPCKAGGEPTGDAVKASRSVRSCEDCLRAKLKRVFSLRVSCGITGGSFATHTILAEEGIAKDVDSKLLSIAQERHI